MSRPLVLILSAALLLLPAGEAAAHDGPPYTVIVDFRASPFLMSVWADPDVGNGTFHIYLERADSALPLPEDTEVSLHVQPEDGRIAETRHLAKRQPARSGQQYFLAEVPFDTQEWWRVRVELASSSGHARAETRVKVTPPGGQGPLVDFAIFLFPFLAVGLLFIKAIVRRRRVVARSV